MDSQVEITKRVREIYQELLKAKVVRNKKDFLSPFGLSGSYITHVLADDPNISRYYLPKRTYDDFKKRYGISEEYFNHGVGQMFTPSSPVYQKDAKTSGSPTDTPYKLLGNDQYLIMAPLVEADEQPTYLKRKHQSHYLHDLPKFPFPLRQNYSGAFLAFEVIGDSMENYSTEELAKKSIPDRSIVAGKEVAKDQWNNKMTPQRLGLYIVVTENAIAVREVIHHDPVTGVISFRTLNESYPSFDLNISEIENIYKVVLISHLQ